MQSNWICCQILVKLNAIEWDIFAKISYWALLEKYNSMAFISECMYSHVQCITLMLPTLRMMSAINLFYVILSLDGNKPSGIVICSIV